MAIPSGRLTHPGTGEAGAPAAGELLAALPTALLLIDGESVVRNCNPAAETLLNLARSTMIGSGIANLTGHTMTSVAPDQPFAAYDTDLITPDERHHRSDIMVAPLSEWPGWRVVLIHGRAIHDLPVRSGRSLSAAAAASLLAHEIKNPLSGIRGAAQLLEHGASSEQIELTRLIRGEVDRVARLVDRMEGLSDTRPRPTEPLNIHTVLGHAREVALAGFAMGRAVREFYDPSLPDVLGNRDALVQVVLNLLKNAAEATGEAGIITLTTAYRHGLSVVAPDSGARLALPIELCVIDDGPGAPEEIVPHLFNPFVTSKPSGGGIGLTLVDKLVSEMGGIVEYAREGDPKRTVFRLLLPRAASGR